MIAFADSMKIAQDDSNMEMKLAVSRDRRRKNESEQKSAQQSTLAKRAVWSKQVYHCIGASEWVSERTNGDDLHSLANRQRLLKDWVKLVRKNVSNSVSPRSLWCSDFCFIFDADLHATLRKVQKNRIGTKFVPKTVRTFLPWMLSYFGLQFWDRKKQRIKRDAL